MKLTYIEIEATAEELKSNRTIADNFMEVLNRALYKVTYPSYTEGGESEGEENDRKD